MPWTPGSTRKFTKKANTPKRRRMWSHVANAAKRRGASDQSAIRQASAVVARAGKKRGRKRRASGRH
jgi:hypothetical protein